MPIPKLLITAGLMAANMALTMTKTTEGPRLDDTKFTGGDYGASLPMVWGKRRLPTSIFWAEDLREVKQRRKTKGGKFNEYTYYGTWAVALAGHELAGVSRVWFDTHLVFDLTGAGPVTPFDFGQSAGGMLGEIRDEVYTGLYPDKADGKSTQYFTFYKGTETQTADPRMEATVEAEFGEGSCPAYRGTAYIVFKDIPLEKLGNRIPQVSVEMVTNPSTALPKQTLTDAWTYAVNILFSPDRALLWVAGNMSFGGPYTIIDAAARANIIIGSQPAEVKAFDPWGTGWADGDSVRSVAPDGTTFGTFNSGQLKYPDGVTNTAAVDLFAFDYGGNPWIGIAPTNGRNHLMYWPTVGAVVSQNTLDITGADWSPQNFCQDVDGDIWAFGAVNGITSTLHFMNVTGGGYYAITGLTATAGGSHSAPVRHFSNGTNDHFLVEWQGDLLIIDRATGALLDTVAFGDSPYIPFKHSSPTDPSWFQYESTSTFNEYSAVDGSIIRTLTLSDWTLGATHIAGIYDAINHAWVALESDGDITWYFLDRIAGAGVTLGTIAGDVADWAGVADHDFSGLDQIVQGWSATQGQGVNIIEPLLDAFDSDIRPHDFGVQGVKRSGVSGGSILTERFVQASPRYTISIRQAAELPRSLTVNFADIDGDQQPNNARSSRPLDSTGARAEQTIDLSTLATDVDEARDLADRYFRRMWNSRQEVKLALTAQHLALEPGDLRTLDLDGESDTYRLVRLTVRADDTLATEWRYDHASLAVLAGGAGSGFDGRNPSTVVVALLSKGFVLDLPLLTDADNAVNPLLYIAAAPYAAGAWSGATTYQAVAGEYSDEFGTTPSTSQATWGYATDVLAAPASPWLWDRGNSVNVALQVGTLTGCTEADIDASPTRNLCLIGDELANFTTATLEGDGTYTLSGFKRGRRGTEWACDSHAVRDVFLLLNTAQDIEAGLSEVGTALSFKAITQGRTESGAFPIPVDFTGASLKPYSPVSLAAVIDGADWDLSWTRRTRVGGAWTSGTSVPLSEASEEYELEIMDGATVKRTVTGLTSPAYTYASADQTTDFGAPLTSAPTFRVYQISDAVGRGFVATS